MRRKIRFAVLVLMALLSYVINVNAQGLENYHFSTGDNGTFLSPTFTELIASGVDDGKSALTGIGFTFVYDGVEYTQFSVNSNGRMRLGGTVIGTTYSNPFNSNNYSGNTPVIAGVGRDCSTGAAGYVKTGLYTDGNQNVRVIECLLNTGSNTAGTTYIKFQFHLYQGSNEVRIVYSGDYTNAPSSYQIGIGNESANKFWYVNPTNHTASYSTTYTSTSYSVYPGAGRYYSFIELASIPYICNFENSIEINRWVLANGSQANYWKIGNETSNSSSNFLYITNDGTANSYTINNATSYVYAYKYIKIESAGEYVVSFKWKCNGESSYDLLRAFLIPLSANPTLTGGAANGQGGNTNNLPTGWIDVANPLGKLNLQTNWMVSSQKVDISTEGVYCLVFFWKNDSSVGSQPPAAIDDIEVASPCTATAAINVGSPTTTSAVITRTSGSGVKYDILVSTSSNPATATESPVEMTSTTQTITGLTPATQYYAYVRSYCSEYRHGAWSNAVSFVTSCDKTATLTANVQSSTSVSLTRTSGDGVKYDILVSTSSNPATASESPVAMTATTQTVSGLTPATQYYAYIRSYCTQDIYGAWSSAVGFVTTCNQTSALSASVQSSTSVVLTRTSGNGVKYDVLVSTSSNPATATESPITMASTTQTITGLSPATQYYAYIRSYCTESLYGAWSSAVEFVTEPACTSVSNLVANADIRTADISWSYANDVLRYEVYVSPRAMSDSDLALVPLINVTGTSYLASGLNSSTPYYVYVRPVCNLYDVGSWSNVRFTTRSATFTLPYDEDFESGTAIGWTFNNSRNGWFVGSATANESTYSLYISDNNGENYEYDNSNTSLSYAYCILNIEEPCLVNVSFDWKNLGENSWDVLRAFMIPESRYPNLNAGNSNGMAGSSNPTPNGWIDVSEVNGFLQGYGEWQHSTMNLVLSETGNYYLVFFWKNDNSAGSNPPAAVDNLSVEIVSTCLPVANVSVDNYDKYSSELSWDANGSASQWQVLVSQSSSVSEATESPLLVNSNTANVSNLMPNTTYYAYVRTYCSESEQSEWSNGVQFTTLPLCVPVKNISIDSYDDTWVNLSWTNVDADASQWQVLVSYSYSAADATETPILVNSTTANVSNLTPDTEYYVHVRAYCSEAEQSDWVSGEYFYTYPTCRPVEDVSVNSYGMTWAVVSWTNVDEDASQWQVLVTTSTNPNSTSATPELVSNTMVTINGLVENTTYNVYVRAYCSQSDQSDWVYGYEFTTLPPCVQPDNIVAVVTPNTATLTWTQQYNVSDFHVYLSETAMSSSELNALTASEYETVDSRLYTNTGLVAGRTYHFYVRTVCGGGVLSDWEHYQFTTTTDEVMSLPYHQNFEGDVLENWHLNNESNGWYMGTAVSWTGARSLYISEDNGVSHNYDVYEMSFSYAYCRIHIDNPVVVSVSFDWLANGETNYDLLRAFMIPVSENPNLSAGAVNGMGSNYNEQYSSWIDVADGNKSGNEYWSSSVATVTLPYSGDYYFVLLWKNDSSGGDNPPAAVDNISIEIVSNCVPVVNLAYSGVGKTSVDLEWNELGNSSQWQVLVTTANSPELATEQPVLVESTSATITGLEMNTEYNVFVRSYCSAEEQSTWSDGLNFTTYPPCVAPYDISVIVNPTQAQVLWYNEYNRLGTRIVFSEIEKTDVELASEEYVLCNTRNKYYSGLTPGRTYHIYATNECGDDELSDWVHFQFATPELEAMPLPYTQDFESGVMENWAISNDLKGWYWGSAVAHDSEKSLYISNDEGYSNEYIDANSYGYNYSYAYCRLNIDHPSVVRVQFDWRCYGRNYMDCLRVFLVPVSSNPYLNAGYDNGMSGSSYVPYGWLPTTNTVALSEYYVPGAGYNWQTNICDINVANAEDYYLVFFWKNFIVDSHNPPAAVDNISVTYLTDCLFSGNVSVNNVSKTSAEISWTTGSSITQWQLLVSESSNIADASEVPTLVSASPYLATGLAENTNYYTYIRSYCSETDHSPWVAGPSFTTLPPCESPYGITASVTSTSVSLNWLQPYQYNNFYVYISQEEMTDSELAFATYSNETATSYMQSDLEPGRLYHAYISSVCSDDEVSEWEVFDFQTPDNEYVTLPYSQDFDSEYVENWYFGNGVNGWYIGSATSVSGKSLYISQNVGSDNTYNIGSISYSYAYIKFNIDSPMGIRVSFDWKAYGEGLWDNMKAFVVPANINPIFSGSNGMNGSLGGAPNGWYDLSGILSGVNNWQHFEKKQLLPQAGDYYMVLFWKNDSGSGENPPAAVDNISIEILSNENDILAFDFDGAENVVIDDENHTVTCNVPYSWNLDNVIPIIEISDSATISPEVGSAIDLNNTFVYTVTAESGIQQEWTVIVNRNVAIADAEILSFDFEGMLSVDINSGNATVDATISRMYNVEMVFPLIEISFLATIDHTSGMSYNFSEPVTFVVTAENGTMKEWMVNISYADSPLGADCANPYVVDAENDLPYIHSSSTAGLYSMMNTYYNDMPEYAFELSGNDAVYRINLDNRKMLNISVSSAGGNLSAFVMNSCGTMHSYMIDSKINDSNMSFVVDCNVGSYYVIIDSDGEDVSYEIQINALSHCYAVNDMDATRLQNELDVEWSSDNVGDSWTLKYGLSGFDVNTGGTEVNVDEPYYDITGLVESTLYDIYVRANCQGGNGNSDWTLLTVSTIASCQAPEDITAVELLDDEVTLSWQGFNMTQWEVGYKMATETEYTTVTVNESTVNITGLQFSTPYNVRIRSICDNDYSGYAEYTFTTICLVVKDFPYTEDFNSGIFPPICWSQERTAVGSGAGLSYVNGAWMEATAVLGDNATPKAMLADTKVGSAHNLSSMGLKFVESINGYNISLDVYRPTALESARDEGVEIWVNTYPDIVNGTPQRLGFVSKNYQISDGENVDGELAAGWYTYTLNARSSAGINYVILVGKSNNAGGVYVDNLTVEKTVDCIAPRNMVVSSVEENHVVLAWSDVNAVNGTWMVRYSLNGGEMVETMVDEPRVTIVGLQSGTEYNISAEIQSICAEGIESEWYNATVNVATDCPSVDLPYTQDFAVSDGNLPECWRSTSSGQNVWSVSNGEAHLSAGNSQIAAHLLTPQFNFEPDVHYALEFDVLQSTQNISRPDSLYVMFVNNETDTIKSIAVQNASSNGMTRMSVVVPQYEGVARFDFVLNGYRECAIDSVVVRLMNREADILTFEIPGQTSSEINAETAEINVGVVYGTDLTALSPIFTISEKASVDVASGELRDFSSPVVYVVTAEDADYTREWIVNVGIDENSCPNPTVDDMNIVAAADSLELTIAQVYNETSYNLKVSSLPIDPESEAGDVFDGVVGNVATVTGLRFHTYYYIYIQANCGASGWTQTGFSTLCGAFEIPYTQDFSADAECWEINDANSDNKTWVFDNGEAMYSFSRTNQADDYLVSPMLSIIRNAKLEFKYRVGNFSYPETFSVYVATDSDTTLLETMTVSNEEVGTFGPVRLSDFAGQVARIMIRCESAPYMYRLYVDDFSVAVSDYVLDVSAVGRGTVTPNGMVEVVPGGSADFSIVPEEHNELLSLTLDGEDVTADIVDNTYTISDVNAEHNLVATFTERYAVTASATEGGQIVTEGVTVVDRGESVSYVVIPDTDYRLSAIMLDGEPVELEQGSFIYTIENIESDHIVVAMFERIIYHTVHIATGANGVVDPSGDVAVVEGENLSLVVIPDEGYRVHTFVVDGVDAIEELSANGNSYTLENVTEDHAVHVTFIENTYYTITATCGEHGTITPNGEVSVLSGEDQSFVIVADGGYHIASVTVDGVDVTSELLNGVYTFAGVTEAHTINAEFEINTYTVVAYAQGGTITPNGSIVVNHGDDITLEFAPDEEYELFNFMLDNQSIEVDGNTFVLDSITSDHVLVVVFVPMNVVRHEIVAMAGEHGSILPGGRVRVIDGENQNFQIVPDEHYYISSLSVDGTPVAIADEYLFENVTDDHTISATFEAYKHIVTAIAGAHGSVTPSGEQEVDEGSSITFEFDPNVGYTVSEVLVDGESVEFSGNSYTLENVLEDHVVNVNFDLLPMWSVTAVVGAHGSIDPEGTNYVLNGDDIEFTFTPDEGYMLDRIVVDGHAIEVEGNTYRFENVTEDHYIYVSFRTLAYFITATAGPHGELSPSGVVEVEPGATKVFTFNPYLGYELDSVFVDGEYIITDGNTYEFADVNANHTFRVTFRHIAVDIEDEVSMVASLYPNPNDGRFMVDFAGISGNVVYQLVNAAGAILVERDVYVDEGMTMEFYHDLKPGVYFARFISGDKVLIERFVVE
ncbi:MAG: fibronectin type III domain-containing protein [Bacteroidales bacterium]|nr:fibronectin type III domain-containing protein [Bacteroidales bacterium]